MMTTTDTHLALTEDEFLARFKPVPNHFDPSRGFDGCMFETFGEELAHVQAQDRNFVWTILDCDGQVLIESGFHFVNRLGYLITTVPAEPDHACAVGKAHRRGEGRHPMSAPKLRTYRVRFQEITCYALDVTAKSESDAIAVAADKFYGLSLADRADAIIGDSSLDYFEAEERGAV